MRSAASDVRAVLAFCAALACLPGPFAFSEEPPPAPAIQATATGETPSPLPEARERPDPAAPVGEPPGEAPDPRETPAEGTFFGEIRVRPENIFDTSDPGENNWIFRLANRLHLRTRAWVIRRQLLFRQGDPYDPRLLAESERLLRSNGYLYDARIRAVQLRDGRVDVDVQTRDVWTLQPGFTFQRQGGKNTTGIDLKEKNLLGLGSSLSIASKSTPDRRENSLNFTDDHLAGSRLRTSVQLASNSDGHRRSFLLEQPFYALDARWSLGWQYAEERRVDSLVAPAGVAGRFTTDIRRFTLAGGWSRGLTGGWTLRYLAGVTRDQARFSAPPGETPTAPLPGDRVFAYPHLGFELVEDNYETAKNRNQIERTEDFYLGLRLKATAGYAFPTLGADRYAVPFNAYVGDGARPGKRWTLTGEATAGGRVEHGSARDTALSASGRVYLELSEHWVSFASVAGSRLVDPDRDHQLTLGGDSGLRGYPMRYQAGDRMYLVTVEQRAFTNWYLFRLVRPGAAAFFDAGRAWGGNTDGLPATGTLCDAGVGLRFSLTRSGLGNVVHVDAAFPFNGDQSISRVQIIVQTKNSF